MGIFVKVMFMYGAWCGKVMGLELGTVKVLMICCLMLVQRVCLDVCVDHAGLTSWIFVCWVADLVSEGLLSGVCVL